MSTPDTFSPCSPTSLRECLVMLLRLKPQGLHLVLGHSLIPCSSSGHWAGAETWGAKRAYCKSTCLLILDRWLSQRPVSALQDREPASREMGPEQAAPSPRPAGILPTGGEHSGQCSRALQGSGSVSQQERRLFGI